MHAMIAISILVEAGAVLTAIILAIGGRENLAIARAVSYGICAAAVSAGPWLFLDHGGVRNRDVWRWPAAEGAWNPSAWWRLPKAALTRIPFALAAGVAAALALGLVAHGYVSFLSHIPQTAELFRKAQEQLGKIPNLRLSYTAMAVLVAPFREEYLFRGLLFRALDREWGGWRAVVRSAAFFAVCHPPISCLPVFLLGAANAVLFKKTGRLEPRVVLHMVYNAVVSA